VIWALINLDRLAEHSEQLVVSGVSSAENNRLLAQQVDSLERVSRQYLVLGNEDSLTLLQQDLDALEGTLDNMAALTEQADAVSLSRAVRVSARRLVRVLSESGPGTDTTEATVAEFATLRPRVERLSEVLDTHIETELSELQESTARAQQISAWQTAALVPGTLILILFFTLLVADRPRDRTTRQGWFFETDRGERPDRSGASRSPARMAALSPARTRTGKESLPAPHVARAEDAACQHT